MNELTEVVRFLVSLTQEGVCGPLDVDSGVDLRDGEHAGAVVERIPYARVSRRAIRTLSVSDHSILIT